MKPNRVVVTGAGVISALGVGWNDTLNALHLNRSGVAPVEFLDTQHKAFPVGEVHLSNQELASIIHAEYPIDELRTVMLGIIAAREALSSAAISPDLLRRAAFINGTTVGGMDKTELHFNSVYHSSPLSNEADELKFNECGAASDLIADSLGKFSFITTSSTACSSAANAIILGANLIKAGVVDFALVGGAEGLTRFHLNGFNTLMILDQQRCRPFDRDRQGINLGEAAAFLLLESEESATHRNVDILGVLSGYANACDAFHQTATSPNADGAVLSISKALNMAGLLPEDIDYINAHGTGTHNNDVTEITAMKRIWNDKIPPFSSTKPLTGHTTSASGSLEAIFALMIIQHQFLPHNLGWANPIIDDIAPLAEDSTLSSPIRHVLSNAFGFGGNDSTLIFSSPDHV
ncbi:MAG: beta-ketoacyl-[acyl-carrier-protein] synthase family protein [Muribaculaceae bacterium]|nr:beta-ketoacyl-[acyl-carrier-protein] synthase family protein [Muribaculaceae bacterium]MDD6701300.1 beta-ketoacyl-[acyl-carrier-protein] synthase family protein [Bacteroidales bacterium]